MGNTQEVWILYSIVLVLNFLVADNLTAAKRHGIERGTAEIIQSIKISKPPKMAASSWTTPKRVSQLLQS